MSSKFLLRSAGRASLGKDAQVLDNLSAGVLLAAVAAGEQGPDLELNCLYQSCCWLALAPREPHTAL